MSEEGLVVLSLFDGISAGQVALERAGIKVKAYYASELDKYPILITQANYPNTIQLGNVTEWREWDIPQPDLIIGGSPCQGFSFAGKQLNFEDPRSKLFFEFSDIIKHYKPKYFLLENVKMKKEYQDVISEVMGFDSIEINSALLSAQNRKRLYWTNIPDVTQPDDRGVMLSDVLEEGSISTEEMTTKGKSYCITARYRGAVAWNSIEKKQRTMVKCGRVVGRKINPTTGKRDDYNPNLIAKQRFEPRLDDKTGTLTTVQKDNVVVSAVGKNPTFTNEYLKFDPNGKGHGSQCNRVNLPDSKHKSLSGTQGGNKHGVVTDVETYSYRKLTPVECERLQTFDDNYTNHVSNTRRYQALGNSWTVDVIAHIFKNINGDENE